MDMLRHRFNSIYLKFIVLRYLMKDFFKPIGIGFRKYLFPVLWYSYKMVISIVYHEGFACLQSCFTLFLLMTFAQTQKRLSLSDFSSNSDKCRFHILRKRRSIQQRISCKIAHYAKLIGSNMHNSFKIMGNLNNCFLS